MKGKGRHQQEREKEEAILPEKKQATDASTRSLSVPLLINVLFSFDSDPTDSQP